MNASKSVSPSRSPSATAWLLLEPMRCPVSVNTPDPSFRHTVFACPLLLPINASRSVSPSRSPSATATVSEIPWRCPLSVKVPPPSFFHTLFGPLRDLPINASRSVSPSRSPSATASVSVATKRWPESANHPLIPTPNMVVRDPESRSGSNTTAGLNTAAITRTSPIAPYARGWRRVLTTAESRARSHVHGHGRP